MGGIETGYLKKFQVALILGLIGYHENSSILFHQFYNFFKTFSFGTIVLGKSQ